MRDHREGPGGSETGSGAGARPASSRVRSDGRCDDITPGLFWILLALVVYMPFEEFLLKWLPVSDQVYGLARLGSEALVYCLLVTVVLGRLAQGRFLRRTPIDWPLLVFVVLAGVSIAINGSQVLPALVTLRTLLRYVALFYVVTNLELDERRIRILLLAILATAVLESGIALLQFAQGGPTAFWFPRASDLEVGGVGRNFSILTGGVEAGAVIGTFGHTVSLALFLLVAAVVVTGILFTQGDRVPRFMAPGWLFALLGVFLTGILLTYSRAAFLGALIGLGVAAWWRRHRREVIRPLTGLAVGGLFLAAVLALTANVGQANLKRTHVSPLENVRMTFGSQVFQGGFSNTRVWILTAVGGTVLRSMTPLGYGPDQETARRKIAARAHGTLDRLLTYGPFEDVFWIAMLSYYGIVGLGVFVWLLVRLFTVAREAMRYKPGLWTRTAATSCAVLLVLLVPLTFLIRTFEYRSLALYFWLLAGITVNRLERVRAWRAALAGGTEGEARGDLPGPASPS